MNSTPDNNDAITGSEQINKNSSEFVVKGSNRIVKENSKPASPQVNSERSTRSRDNPDFIAKQKSFMAKVQAASVDNEERFWQSRSEINVAGTTIGKRKRDSSSCQSNTKRKRNKVDQTQEWVHDNCCWDCHREGQFICCEMCPRVFHLKCTGLEKEPDEDWACTECHSVMEAENAENRSRAMQLISVDQLCILLNYALERLIRIPGLAPFCQPVDDNEFPSYYDVVIHPVDFMSLGKNIKKKFYGSTEAFISDTKWIVHNSIIFNGANSKVTTLARSLLKILKQELSEIETCPDCYENAHEKPDSWFTEVCKQAHPLVWARLKGFPFWPAKAVKWKDSNVDVRFFGRHDRSWVPIKECFLFSDQMPTPLKSKNKTLESCLIEVSDHIEKLKRKFGKFNYADHRITFNPFDVDQIKLILPQYKGPPIMRVRSNVRSLSRQSMYSGTDDETSSITSTDSLTSHYLKRKCHIKERMSPDTEPDIDNINNDEGDTTDKSKEPTNQESEESTEIEEKPESPNINNKISATSAPFITSTEEDSKSENQEAIIENVDSQQQALAVSSPLIDEEKLKKAKPGPLSRKIKRIASENKLTTNGIPNKEDPKSPSIIDNFEKLNALLRQTEMDDNYCSDKEKPSKSENSGDLSFETQDIINKLPFSSSIKFSKISDYAELPQDKSENSDVESLSDAEGRMEIDDKEMELPKIPGEDCVPSSPESSDKSTPPLTITSIGNVETSQALENITEEQENTNTLSKSLSCENSSEIDYKKLFKNNITIRTSKSDGENIYDKLPVPASPPSDEKIVADDGNKTPDAPSESLLKAVRLLQNVGNIAIKHLDSKTMEHTSGNDKITISVADKSSPKTPKLESELRTSLVVSGIPPLKGNVSVTKACDKLSKLQQPDNATIQMNPLISIIPMLSQIPATPIDTKPNNVKFSPSTSSPSTSFQSNAILTQESPATPSHAPLPIPLLLSNLSSPSNSNIFTSHLPTLQLHGGLSSQPVRLTNPSPLRIIPNAPGGVIMGGRIPLVRHLPSDAGPLSLELQKHSHKMAEMMRTSLEEVLTGLVGIGTPEARLAALQLELERCNWRHQQEVIEVRHNADVMLVEMRANLEAEKQRAVEETHRQMKMKVDELRRQMEMQLVEKINEVKRQLEIEKQRAVEETKKKQWCANCGKEGLFFCCWNTSYCDYPCQQAHWPQHMSVCGQNSDSGGATSTMNSEGESINGDANSHSSRVSTPMQNNKYLTDEEEIAEERKRKMRRESLSSVYPDMGRSSISPAASANLVNNATMGTTSPLCQSLNNVATLRPNMATIAGITGSQHSVPNLGIKMPQRFLQHNIIQQQPIFTSMDQRMVMMMGRNMPGPPSVMLRNHLQPFRPRYM